MKNLLSLIVIIGCFTTYCDKPKSNLQPVKIVEAPKAEYKIVIDVKIIKDLKEVQE